MGFSFGKKPAVGPAKNESSLTTIDPDVAVPKAQLPPAPIAQPNEEYYDEAADMSTFEEEMPSQPQARPIQPVPGYRPSAYPQTIPENELPDMAYNEQDTSSQMQHLRAQMAALEAQEKAQKAEALRRQAQPAIAQDRLLEVLKVFDARLNKLESLAFRELV